MGVLIIAIIAFIGGLFTFFAGLPVLFPILALGLGFFETVPYFTALFWVFSGIVMMVAAVALFRLRLWAWWLLFLINLFAVISVIANAAATGYVGNWWIPLIFPVIVVLYLIAVKRLFKPMAPKPVPAA